jgi:transcriptional regulator NrdR family protein
MPSDGHYARHIVSAFLTAHGLRRADGKLVLLNGEKVTESNRDMVHRWETSGTATVELEKVDRLLMNNELMLWELEKWAYVRYGTTGYREDAEPTVLRS